MLNARFPHDTLTRFFICAASGACASLCFEPYGLGFLAYFIFIPFILFSGVVGGDGRYLLNSFIFGFSYFMGTLYWIAFLDKQQMTIPWLRLPAAVAASLYLSVFVLIAGFLMRRVIKAGIPYQIAIPVVWGGVEYLRSLGVMGFPWGSIAYSQTPYASVIQQVALVGTYGLSAWLVAVNALIVWFITSRRRAALAALLIVLAVPIAAGRIILWRADYDNGPGVSLVQPNISGQVKWDKTYRDSTMRILSEMTLEVSGSPLIVWPETAVPFFLRHQNQSMRRVKNLAGAADSYILFGLPDFVRSEEGNIYYNSAMLMGPEGEDLGVYRKIHLVPFGEMIPYEDTFDILKRINFGEGDFSPGEEPVVMEVEGIPFGVAICFESIFPDLTRQFARRGARFFINITNDEWFGPSLGPSQHAQMAVLRTVECRMGLIRCANTGISMIVDPYGRTIKQTELFKRTAISGNIPVGSGETPFVHAGEVFASVMLLSSIVLGLIAGRRPRL